MMRILHVNNYAKGGGTERYIQLLIRYLTDRGHICDQFVPVTTPGNHPLKAWNNTRENLARLEKAISGFQPDVIHVHNILNYRLLNCLQKAAPCLKSIHEFRPFCTVTRILPDGSLCDSHLTWKCFRAGCFQMSPGSVYRAWADRRSLREVQRFEKIWVFSNYMKHLIEPFFDSDSIIQYPYFHDSSFESAPDPTIEPNIFAAGRLAPGKGFDLLLKAASFLDIPYRLKIAGTGSDMESLRKTALDLRVAVEFMGYQDPEALGEWYRWSRVVAFPSDYPEPFGIVGLEAMGAGRPVVAFDVGGVCEWLENGATGHLVPRRDIQRFADALRLVLTDDKSARILGGNAWNRLKIQFNSSGHMDLLESVYCKLSRTETDDPFRQQGSFETALFHYPVGHEIDLHTFSPGETRQATQAYLEAAFEKGYRRVRIIHGKGRGVQRKIIQSLLDRHDLVDFFEDAPLEKGGSGATIVHLREQHEE